MHSGRPDRGGVPGSGYVNIPAWRGSTVVFDTLDVWDEQQANRADNVVYGRLGSETTKALEAAICAMQPSGGAHCVLYGSGLAANSLTLVTFLNKGDHLLIVDTIYSPVRAFADRHLSRFGVTTEYFDPLIGAGIADLIRPETRLVFCETPGSQTFEMLDLPAVSAAAKAAAAHPEGLLVVADNTWATPFLFDTLGKGADIETMACTKYILGHSDGMLGAATTQDEELSRALRFTAESFGSSAGSEECWLGLRGIRTLPVRLRQHHENALAVAGWLENEPRVSRVMCPALPAHPGHDIWKRDFSGTSGLLAVVLDKAYPRDAIAAFIDGLELFGLGASWGGYESLVLHFEPAKYRTATVWTEPSPTLRFHIGLEHPDDLIADLDAAFRRLEATE